MLHFYRNFCSLCRCINSIVDFFVGRDPVLFRKKGIKMRKEKSCNVLFRPNRMLYITLLIIALVLTLLCITIPQISPWFAIGTGICCGAVASIIVAWLIDIYNCNQASARAIEHRDILFKKLFSTFDNGLQVLIYEYEEYFPDYSAKKWYEWIRCAYDQTIKTPDFCSEFNRIISQFLGNIKEQTLNIQCQESLLLEFGIICGEDVDAFNGILNTCDVAKAEYHSKKYNSLEGDKEIASRFVKRWCYILQSIIDQSPSLRLINNRLIEPRIYKLLQKE